MAFEVAFFFPLPLREGEVLTVFMASWVGDTVSKWIGSGVAKPASLVAAWEKAPVRSRKGTEPIVLLNWVS